MKNQITQSNDIKNVRAQVAIDFGKRLKLLRKQKDISMEELALAVGSTKSAISRYENGHVSPTLDTARKLAEYFMVTVDWLGGDGDEAEIMADIPQPYVSIVKYAINKNITAEQLKAAVDFALHMREK